MKSSIIFTVALLIISCHATENPVDEKKLVDVPIAEIGDCNFMPYSEIFENVNLVVLETNENSLIGKVDKVLYYDSTILVLDKLIAKSVLMFREDGSFVRKVGKIGGGPGEYISPADMDINQLSKEIFIYDNAKGAINVYGLNGEYKHEIKLENRTERFAVLDNDTYALYFNYDRDEEIDMQPKHNLHIIDSKLKILQKGFDRTNSKVPSREGANAFSLSGGDLLFHPSFDNKIYRVSSDGISVIYRFNFGKLTLTEDLIVETIANTHTLEEAINAIENAGKVYIRDFSQTNNYVILNIVHDHLVKNVFYSKHTGKVKIATILFNDMYGLIPGLNNFSGFEDDMAISYFIPDQVPLQYYQSLLNASTVNSKYISNEMVKGMNNAPLEGECIKVIHEFLDTLHYNATPEESSKIMKLNQNSNPVLFLHKIKRF